MPSASSENLFSFHLVRTTLPTTVGALVSPPSPNSVEGLRHVECMSLMTLGAPIFSPARMQLQNLVMFAVWEDQDALERFLENSKLGQILSSGWHVRMSFLRRWGKVAGLEELPASHEDTGPDSCVVAVTLARMKPLQIPRFIRWGKPVEELVRDHPGKSLALASMRVPGTVSTFTIWHSQKEMLGMVSGHSSISRPKRHVDAMKERERKDFHFEFTTLRFKPLAEFGSWDGRTNILPLKA